MANIDRFFQDLGNMKKSPIDLSSYEPITEERNFLDKGTIVRLKGDKSRDITIVDRLAKHEGKLYDYAGEFEDASLFSKKVHIVYFDEEDIEEVK